LLKKAAQIKIPLNLPTGQWQIFRYGRLTSVPDVSLTPFIVVYLRQVVMPDRQIVKWLPNVCKTDLPVSDMTALPIGTVVCEDRAVPGQPLRKDAQEIDVAIDFTRINCQALAGIELEREGIFDRRSDGACLRGDQDFASNWIAVGSYGQGPLHLFPCTAIFQFFWAHSSMWAQLMVDGRFVDYSRYVFNPHRSHRGDGDSAAMLWLRQWMLDADARFIATIAFDDYALKQGANIFLHLARSPGDRTIRAFPPYEGNMRLRLRRHLVRTKDKRDVWFVSEILQSDYKSPIERVRFDRDNDGRPHELALDSTSKKKPISRISMPFGGPPQTVLGNVTVLSPRPHRNGAGPALVHLEWLSGRFPQMDEGMRVEKVPQADTQYETQEQAARRYALWSDEISTLRDAKSSAELAPQGILTGQAHRQTLQQELEAAVCGDAFELAEGLLNARGDEIEFAGEVWTVSVEPIIIGRPSLLYPFFLVPPSIDGQRWAWRYVDPEKQYSKRGVCLRVQFTCASLGETRVRYLLDFEERQGNNQHSVLIFWDTTNGPLAEEAAAVGRIVEIVAEAKTTRVPAERMPGLQRRLRKHPRGGSLRTFWQDLFEPQPARSQATELAGMQVEEDE
jgi:hypothetical protein